MPETTVISGEYAIAKADDSLQNVFGWASVAVAKNGATVVDGEGDIIDVADLELAAYDFVLDARGSGEDHNGEPVDGQLIESVVFTEDKVAALGLEKGALPLGWFVGFHIPDRGAYERTKTSKAGFSIEGRAVREPV